MQVNRLSRVLLSIALFVAVLSLGSRPASAQSTGELHVLGVTTVPSQGQSTGGVGLRHAVRFSTNGGWSGFGDVEGAAGDIGTVIAADATYDAAQSAMHVVAINSLGVPFHTIRFANGSWQRFSRLNVGAGWSAPAYTVGLTASSAGIHVCIDGGSGTFWHTIRNSNGSWTAAENVRQKTGGPSGVSVSHLDCAVQGNLLHFVVSGGNGETTSVWHATRTLSSSNPTWSAFGNVSQAARLTGRPMAVAVTAMTEGLHVVASTTNVDNTRSVKHAIRSSSGAWQSFATVPGALDVGFVSLAVSNVATHLVVRNGVRLLHATRPAFGAWSAFGDIGGATGSTESFHNVGIAGRTIIPIP